MTMPLTRTRNRNLVAAVLAGGLLMSLSACGGSNPSAAPVSESQPIPGPPLVACGMTQLSPRVPDNDPVLGRANTFYNQLDQAQLVPPAVQTVYQTDVAGLNPDQQHEVLLMLSSLNECPGLSPQLQQSVLDVFDQLTPQTVADPDASDNASGPPVVVIRTDNSTVENSSPDYMWWDGEWAGHPWWFRPAWDHPITDNVDWVQWGHDRRAGVVWRWENSGWRRIGRPTDDPPDRPWLPREIGPGLLNHEPGRAGGPTQYPMPAQPAPLGVPTGTASAQPDTSQQIVRPNFRDSRPNDTTGGPTGSAPGSDQQPARTSTDTGSDSNTTRNDTSSTPTGSGSADRTNVSTPTPRPQDRSDDLRNRTDQSSTGSTDSTGPTGDTQRRIPYRTQG